MLRTSKSMKNYSLDAEDGKIGKCKDFLFDDFEWTIRYMVADTGSWIPGREVLLTPLSLGMPNDENDSIPVHLTKKQIEDAPSVESDKPISRQYEMEMYTYYGYQIPTTWPYAEGYPYLTTPKEEAEKRFADTARGDPHLRSAKEVSGYHIEASDGEIGHIEDFLVEDDNWRIRYIVVDTRNWLPGKKVLIAPAWIEKI
ncbi:MAG: photosystem reaction center subunit H [Deltaproteobacteria bacterium CG_4_10_14_0_2_um_filter_43_8]|nr:MAG: photosystem reaction center subunit H [Deltaproteobacteria bacterium CG11_big_fil_rev_8_21_14_0_20_42_23]PJA19041.1 MAG: photosystem reaction center subunit H [Deltaproteobacteria bacterium CG_4_10_14_0_2_um_filter_43_8]PJC65177.1 MAG: photosystem reaction center subunit H [Deltaproteobacteria bacterium CG_4_9_14_0_2_um_filter_42_21]